MSLLVRIKFNLWRIKNVIYRNTSDVITIRKSVDALRRREKAKIPLIIRHITEADAELYGKVRFANTKKNMLDRLSKGHIGLCAIHEGKMVGFTWRAFDEIWIDEHKIMMKIPPKHRFGYDGYTHPDYRRLGVHLEVVTSSHNMAIEKNYPNLISLISIKNEASLKLQEKSGGKRLGIINTKYFLWFVSRSIESDNEENRKQIKTFFNM